MSNASTKAEVIAEAKTPNFQYHRKDQVQALEREAFGEKEKVKDAKLYNTPIEGGLVTRRLRQINGELDKYRPPEIGGMVKDALAKHSNKLVEEIREGMPTTEVMDRNPVGAVHAHTEWSKANKQKVLEWKNIQVVLNPDSDDPDLRNFEKHRPAMNFSGGNTSFMPDGQLGGHLAFSEAAKENFPKDMGNEVNSALAQAEACASEESEEE